MVHAPTDGWGDAPHRAASNRRSGSSIIWPLIMSWVIGIAVDVNVVDSSMSSGHPSVSKSRDLDHLDVVREAHHLVAVGPLWFAHGSLRQVRDLAVVSVPTLNNVQVVVFFILLTNFTAA